MNLRRLNHPARNTGCVPDLASPTIIGPLDAAETEFEKHVKVRTGMRRTLLIAGVGLLSLAVGLPPLPFGAALVSMPGKPGFGDSVSGGSVAMLWGIRTEPLQYGQAHFRPVNSSRTLRDFSQCGHLNLKYMTLSNA